MDWNIGMRWVTFLNTKEDSAFFSLYLIFSNHFLPHDTNTYVYKSTYTEAYMESFI